MANKPDYIFNTQDPDQLFQELQDWEDRVRSAYAKYTKKHGNPAWAMKGENAVNLNLLLRALPLEDSEALMFQYKKIIQFKEVMSKINLAKKQPVTYAGSDNPYWKLNVDPDQLNGGLPDPLAFIWNRLSIQDYGDGPTIGKNILSTSFLKNIFEDAKNADPFEIGKSVFVFDTETAGLLEEFGGIRQVSGVSAKVVADPVTGRPTLQMGSDAVDEYFNVSRMQAGSLANEGNNPVRMSEWVQNNLIDPKGKKVSKDFGAGADFVEGIKPLLERIRDADYVVAHNITFDINQILVNVVQTNEYIKNIDGFRDLVDETRKQLLSPGKVKDTLEMARIMFPALETAEELKFAGKTSMHSVENLLLKTNLIELLEGELGATAVGDLLGMGSEISMLHGSDVDTKIEAYLLKYMINGELEESLTGPNADYKAAILKSYAPTPTSNIRNPEHIDRRLFNRMVEESQTGVRKSVKVFDPATNQVVDITTKTSDELWESLTKGELYGNYDISPMEQEIWQTRKALAAKPIPAKESVWNLGEWRKYAGVDNPYQGFLNKVGSIFKRGQRPAASTYSGLQSRLADNGIPFAGLSEIERMYTHALSGVGNLNSSVGDLLGSRETKLAKVGDDLGISRFRLSENVYVSPRSKAVNLPLELIQEAEKAGILSTTLNDPSKGLPTLSVSPYETSSGKPMVNLNYDFENQVDRASFSWWLKDEWEKDEPDSLVRKFMPHQEDLDDVLEGLDKTGDKFGVKVGFMDGEAAAHAYEGLSSLFQGLQRDSANMPFRAGVIDTEGGVARLGAFFLDRFKDEQGFQDSYRADLDRVRGDKRGSISTKGLQDEMQDALEKRGIFRGIASTFGPTTGKREKVKALVEAYPYMRRKTLAGLGIGALLAGGYYINQRQKTRDMYSESLNQMPIETRSDYSNYRNEMGLSPAPATRAMDPLLTAGLTGNMDRLKTGHTNMSNTKHNHLYQGML